MYNNSSSFNRLVPSGEQIWFGCEPGFYPTEPVVSTCQEDGLWHPDPNKVVCQSKKFACCYYSCVYISKMHIFHEISEECLVQVNLTNLELRGDSSASLRIFFRCKDGFVPKEEQTAVFSI